MNKRLKGSWFDSKGDVIIKDGIALRDIEVDEELVSYGDKFLYFGNQKEIKQIAELKGKEITIKDVKKDGIIR